MSATQPSAPLALPVVPAPLLAPFQIPAAHGGVNLPPQVVFPVVQKPAPGTLEEEDEGEDGTAADVFASYACKSLSFGKPHPADVSESAGLAMVPLPKATYPLQESLPASLIDTGKLSSLQLEGVLYACQRHCTMLPDGTRAGFFLGDGAGIGKGRQISGILLDNWARGRKQHVWISTSGDLKLDAERDLRDLGVHFKVIDGCQQLDAESRAFGLSKDFKEGVLFVTYSTLIGGSRGSKASRLDQIVNWCKGEDFEGVLVLDECHKAKNFLVGENADNSTKTSKCVIELQRRMPRARVVYSSATGVTELGNLAYCERLGLWGKGSPFSDFEGFLNVVSKRGVFFLEMLAMELKRSGAYVSRGLSFAAAEFETINAKLTPQQAAIYDAAAAAWYQIRVKLQKAIEKTRAARTMQMYWSSHQRFFRQLIVSFKVDAVCEDAQQCLAQGYAVVIGLQMTGEAVMTRRINSSKGGSLGWLSSARETMLSFLEMHFPVEVKEGKDFISSTQNDDEVEEIFEHNNSDVFRMSQSQTQAQSKAVGTFDDECVDMRDELIREARDLDLPFSALDMFMETLGGPKEVAEMTGRTGRLVRGKDGVIAYELRGKGDADLDRVNVNECKRFMDGEKHVAIISDAASTGISLHARRGGGNERRRVHFTVELPWSADKAVQQLGRSHRSNQSSAPIYRLVVTDLGGERRFAAAVAKRLQSLGALTKGDRRAAAGQDLQEFNLDTIYGKLSLRKVLDAIELGSGLAAGADEQELFDAAEVSSLEQFQGVMSLALEFIGMGPTQRTQTEQGGVRRFLGRLLGLPVLQQNALYLYFFSVLKHEIATAQKEGRYSDAITDLFGGDGTVVERVEPPQSIFTDPLTGSTCAVHKLNVDRGLAWEKALARLEAAEPDDKNGFYESKREVPGRNQKGWLLATRKSDDSFFIARPNTGISRQEMDETDLIEKYTLRTEEKAQPAWERIFAESLDYTKGARVLDVVLVCGSLVLLWNQLQDIVKSHALRSEDKSSTMTARDAGMKVVRVKVGQEHLVGLRLPPEVIADVISKLKEHEMLLSGRAIKVVPPILLPASLLALSQYPGAKFPMKMQAAGTTVDGAVSQVNGKVMVSFVVPGGELVTFPLPKGPGGIGTACNPVMVRLGEKPKPADSDKGQGDAAVGSRGRIENVTEVDAASLKRALTAPATLRSFFTVSSEGPSVGKENDKDRDKGKGARSDTGRIDRGPVSAASREVVDVDSGVKTIGEKRPRPEAVMRGSSKESGKKSTPPTEKKKPRTVLSFFHQQTSSQQDKPEPKLSAAAASKVAASETIDLTLD